MTRPLARSAIVSRAEARLTDDDVRAFCDWTRTEAARLVEEGQ